MGFACRFIFPLETHDPHPMSLQLWELWGKNLQLSPDVWNVWYLKACIQCTYQHVGFACRYSPMKLSLTITFTTRELWGENLHLSPDVWNVWYLKACIQCTYQHVGFACRYSPMKLSLTITFTTRELWGENSHLSLDVWNVWHLWISSIYGMRLIVGGKCGYIVWQQMLAINNYIVTFHTWLFPKTYCNLQ